MTASAVLSSVWNRRVSVHNTVCTGKGMQTIVEEKVKVNI